MQDFNLQWNIFWLWLFYIYFSERPECFFHHWWRPQMHKTLKQVCPAVLRPSLPEVSTWRLVWSFYVETWEMSWVLLKKQKNKQTNKQKKINKTLSRNKHKNMTNKFRGQSRPLLMNVRLPYWYLPYLYEVN